MSSRGKERSKGNEAPKTQLLLGKLTCGHRSRGGDLPSLGCPHGHTLQAWGIGHSFRVHSLGLQVNAVSLGWGEGYGVHLHRNLRVERGEGAEIVGTPWLGEEHSS